jgi:hypothetical protein
MLDNEVRFMVEEMYLGQLKKKFPNRPYHDDLLAQLLDTKNGSPMAYTEDDVLTLIGHGKGGFQELQKTVTKDQHRRLQNFVQATKLGKKPTLIKPTSTTPTYGEQIKNFRGRMSTFKPERKPEKPPPAVEELRKPPLYAVATAQDAEAGMANLVLCRDVVAVHTPRVRPQSPRVASPRIGSQSPSRIRPTSAKRKSPIKARPLGSSQHVHWEETRRPPEPKQLQ